MDPNIPNQSIKNETSVQQQSPLPKKNNFKKMFWIFFIVLILIAFVAGGFFMGAKQNKLFVQNQQKSIIPTTAQSTPTLIPTSIINPTNNSSSTINPTANWKTYANTKYNFAIMYPNNWYMVQCDEIDPMLIGFSNNSSNLMRCQTEGQSDINIYIISKSLIKDEGYNYPSFNNVIEGAKNRLEKVLESDILLDNSPAKKIVGTVPSDVRELSPIGTQETHVIFSHNGIIYQIYNSGIDAKNIDNQNTMKIFDQMLSTFKFTN